MLIGLKAKLYAIIAAAFAIMIAVIKVLTMQRDAAKEDARRAKKHLEEGKKIVAVEKEIHQEMKEKKRQAVEAIRDGQMPDNIRNRNDF